jgi:diaminopimelate decarboxylase
MPVQENRLLLGGIAAESLARDYGTPLYVYEEDVVKQRYADLTGNIGYRPLEVHYAL